MTEAQSTEVPVREGDVLAGKYRVERVLGVGGMGVVVAAMHTELDQRVALKFLLPSAAQNPAVVARFSREARAAAKIKSEHVARVSDVGTMDNGLPYIVMEYLDGHDLAHALTIAAKLPPGASVDYVLQACEALAEAHAAGFVHRDLKPGNLFLAKRADGSAIIKVLDFGISKAVIGEGDPASQKPGSLTKTTDVFGSPMYMSPEQLKSSRDVDARADIWALGVILYELLSGKSPFDRETVAETFGAILYEQPAPLTGIEGVTPDLDRAVRRCLEKDLTLRYPNVAELAKALFPFAEHSTRQTLERTARVLKRAGHEIDTLPPPRAQAATNLAPAGASTRTSWGAAERAVKPGSSRARAAAFIGAGVVLAVALGLGAMRFWKPRANVSAAANPDTSAVAKVASAPVISAAPPVPASVSAAPPPASAEPSAPPAGASAAPTVSPGPTLTPAHGKPWPARTGAPAQPPSTSVPAPPPPAPPPPPPVVKHPEDPNDFGDRK